MIFLIFLGLFSVSVRAEIVLSPVEVKSFTIGEVVEFEMIQGQENFASSDGVSAVFNQIESSKLILMKHQLMNGKIILKLAIGATFNDKEKLPIKIAGLEETLGFTGVYLMNTPQKKEEGFLYQESELLKINKNNYVLWVQILIAVILLVASSLGIKKAFYWYKKSKNKKMAKQSWMRRLESSQNLTSCSTLWLDRDQMRRDLSEYLVELNSFLEQLSPDQFSPSVDEGLSEKIIEAKNELIKKMKEGRRGV